MQAVILVGGFGTRLRPFTFEDPKPLIPFVNKAIVEHQIDALVKVGVRTVYLAVGHQSDKVRRRLMRNATADVGGFTGDALTGCLCPCSP